MCVQKIISGFDRKVWKAKPRFCSRHSCAGMSTTASSGTGLGGGGSGSVKPEKIMSPDGAGEVESTDASTAAWYASALCEKMIEDMVRPYSMLTSEMREEALSWRSLSRSVFNAKPSIREIRSFSIGGSSSVGMHSMNRE